MVPYDDDDDSFDPPDEEAIEALGELGEAADEVDHASHPPKPYHLRADSGALLETDLPCIHCNYNLRGQRTDGNCSECGTPIAHSLRSDLLKFSSPTWLRGLKQGVMWVLIGTFTGIGLGMVAGGVQGALQGVASQSVISSGNPFVPPPTPMPAIIIGIIAVLIPNLMSGFGYWRLTEPEPPPSKERASRSIARWTMVPACGLSIIASLFTLGQSDAAVFMSSGIDVLAGVVGMVGFPAIMIYLRLLAIRSQDRGLAKQTSIVMWGLIISAVAFVIAAVVLLIAFAGSPTNPPGSVIGLLFVLGCPTLLAMLTFIIWWVVLMFFYQSRFTKMANLAIKHRREEREHRIAQHGPATSHDPFA